MLSPVRSVDGGIWGKENQARFSSLRGLLTPNFSPFHYFQNPVFQVQDEDSFPVAEGFQDHLQYHEGFPDAGETEQDVKSPDSIMGGNSHCTSPGWLANASRQSTGLYFLLISFCGKYGINSSSE